MLDNVMCVGESYVPAKERFAVDYIVNGLVLMVQDLLILRDFALLR
jgi:hypothetical protein